MIFPLRRLATPFDAATGRRRTVATWCACRPVSLSACRLPGEAARRTGRATGGTGARDAQAARDRRAHGADAAQGNGGGNPAKRHGTTHRPDGCACRPVDGRGAQAERLRLSVATWRSYRPVSLSACRLPGDGRTDAARCPGAHGENAAHGTRHRRHRSARRTGRDHPGGRTARTRHSATAAAIRRSGTARRTGRAVARRLRRVIRERTPDGLPVETATTIGSAQAERLRLSVATWCACRPVGCPAVARCLSMDGADAARIIRDKPRMHRDKRGRDIILYPLLHIGTFSARHTARQNCLLETRTRYKRLYKMRLNCLIMSANAPRQARRGKDRNETGETKDNDAEHREGRYCRRSHDNARNGTGGIGRIDGKAHRSRGRRPRYITQRCRCTFGEIG